MKARAAGATWTPTCRWNWRACTSALAGHLATFGLGPDAREISGHLTMALHTEPLPDPATGVSAKITLDNVDL